MDLAKDSSVSNFSVESRYIIWEFRRFFFYIWGSIVGSVNKGTYQISGVMTLSAPSVPAPPRSRDLEPY